MHLDKHVNANRHSMHEGTLWHYETSWKLEAGKQPCLDQNQNYINKSLSVIEATPARRI